MPIIRYNCSCGHSVGKFIKAGGKAPAFLPCPECKQDMYKTLSGPTSDSKIKVDNGVQARPVEINVESIKDSQNRARFIQKMREKP